MSPLEDVRGIDGAEDHEEPEAPKVAGEPEVHEVLPERRRRRRHGRNRHRRRRPEEEPGVDRKKLMTIGLVALVVIGSGIAWYLWGPTGSIAKIDLIARPYTENATSIPGVSLAAFIDAGKPSSLSGSGDLRISFNGTGVYSGQMSVSESRAMKNVPYNLFVTGNGDYRIQFTYQGFTTTTIFPITDIIEKMNLTAFNLTALSSPSIVQPGTARVGLTVTFLNNDDYARLSNPNDRIDIEIIRAGASDKHAEPLGAQTQLNKNYTVPGNGNYTVKAVYTNSKVKAGSKFSRIEATGLDYQTRQPYVTVTIPPMANGGPDKSAQWKVADNGAVVSFDGTGSLAYEGATIVQYSWDFGDFTGDEGSKVTHTYTMLPDATKPLVYEATLIITDSNGQFSSDKVQVTVRL